MAAAPKASGVAGVFCAYEQEEKKIAAQRSDTQEVQRVKKYGSFMKPRPVTRDVAY
jgi:hypothetical protein